MAIVKNDVKLVYKKVGENTVSYPGNFYTLRRSCLTMWIEPLLCVYICVFLKIEEGADVNFEFGVAYSCKECYTPLMAAAHRGRYECCKALLRSGADPNYCNKADDIVLFWGIDGGVEIIKLLYEYGADLDFRTAKDWTPLSYAKACGKYGLAYEKGIYPEDVLKYYGASEYGSGPPALGTRSPRESYDPESEDFSRERGSYQNPPEHP